LKIFLKNLNRVGNVICTIGLEEDTR